MPLRALIATLVLAVSGITAHAATAAYGEAFDTLYAIDLANHQASAIGPAGSWSGASIANVEGLTYSPGGKLYAVSDTLLKALLTIDPATGGATVVGALGGNGGLGEAGQGTFDVLDLGLAFTCDGRLWLSSGYTGSLWQVDPASGNTTRIGNLGATITGLAARGNELFGAGSQGDPYLYSINTANAQATALGPYGAGIQPITTASIGFDANGRLWSILDNVPPLPPQQIPEWSTLASVNTNGAMTSVGDITSASGAHGPTNATQLPYVGLKGLAIASPCAAAQGPGIAPAPAFSAPGLFALIALIALGAGTSRRFRRQRI